jgi:hypothetical protein
MVWEVVVVVPAAVGVRARLRLGLLMVTSRQVTVVWGLVQEVGLVMVEGLESAWASLVGLVPVRLVRPRWKARLGREMIVVKMTRLTMASFRIDSRNWRGLKKI